MADKVLIAPPDLLAKMAEMGFPTNSKEIAEHLRKDLHWNDDQIDEFFNIKPEICVHSFRVSKEFHDSGKRIMRCTKCAAPRIEFPTDTNRIPDFMLER